MLSSNRNIETIAQFVEESKEWFSLQAESAKYVAIDKVVRILSALALVMVLSLLGLLTLICVSVAGASALGVLLENDALGYLVFGCAYMLLFVVVYAMRKAWIERPLVRFLVKVLTDDSNAEVGNETATTN